MAADLLAQEVIGVISRHLQLNLRGEYKRF